MAGNQHQHISSSLALTLKENMSTNSGRQLVYCLALFAFPVAVAFQDVWPVQQRHVAAFSGSGGRRGQTKLESMPILDDWKILPSGRVEGKVINHPDIEDGWVISTSPLKTNMDGTGQNEVINVETLSGSQYLLRTPNRVEYSDEAIYDKDMSARFFPTPSPGEMQMGVAATGLRDRPAPAENEADYAEPPKQEKMSEAKKLMQQVKDSGIAGVISYALWEFGFWTVSVPVCIFAYKQVTGHWPDFSNEEDLKKLGAEAFAFVNVARFAVPLRIGLALSTTPWIQKKIVDRFQQEESSSSSLEEETVINQ